MLSQALRNALLLVDGLAMLTVASIKLTLFVMLMMPIGRRAQHLSRDSQDAIGALGAHAEEAINEAAARAGFNSAIALVVAIMSLGPFPFHRQSDRRRPPRLWGM
jgi:hypothetical protein